MSVSVGLSLNVGVCTVELSVMAELDPFGAPAGAPGGPALGNGVAGAGEEDPAAAFLAQQESEIAGIENDEAFAILDGGAPGPQPHGEPPGGPGENAGRVWGGRTYMEIRPEMGLRSLCNSCSLRNREVEECREETRPDPLMRKPRLWTPTPF